MIVGQSCQEVWQVVKSADGLGPRMVTLVESYLIPLLNSIHEALVFESGCNILLLSRKSNNQRPNWIKIVVEVRHFPERLTMKAFVPLLQRDSASSNAVPIMKVSLFDISLTSRKEITNVLPQLEEKLLLHVILNLLISINTLRGTRYGYL